MTDHAERLDVQTVTENAVTVAFARRERGVVRVELRARTHEAAGETVQRERVGRLCLGGLTPDTSYELHLRVNECDQCVGTVRTLPAPVGELHASFAVVSDPHVTQGTETRRGRLFVEGPVLLREVVREANARKVDAILMPGDITEAGAPDEFSLAGEILSTAASPVLAVPGDHDVREGPDRFEREVGPVRWVRELGNLRIIGCHTGRKALGEDGLRHVLNAVAGPTVGCTFLVSHLQLVADGYIVDDDRAVRDWAKFQSEAVPRMPCLSIAYAGHKNVPSRVATGRFVQFNVPQPVQYPCGWLHVRVFDNGVYHTFQPIFSEWLNECSRMGNEELGVPKWATDYRRGAGWDVWNCVVK